MITLTWLVATQQWVMAAELAAASALLGLWILLQHARGLNDDER